MFNDKYGLTKAVLEGRKTMTRRIIKAPRTMEGKDVYGFSVVKYPHTGVPIEAMALDADLAQINNILPKYKVGEVVAVAQSYKDIREEWGESGVSPLVAKAGYRNKMYVRADLMPHRIRITDVRIELMQDITDEDCLREGITREWLVPGRWFYHLPNVPVRSKNDVYLSHSEAFSVLINKLSRRDVWEINPYVFVYSFELVK